MSSILCSWIVVAALAAGIAPMPADLPATAANPRHPLWLAVADSLRIDLPRSALALLDSIYPEALRVQAYPEAIKAQCLQIALRARLEGGKPEEKITRLEAALPTCPAPMRPVLEAVLAHWYWQYFQSNRWRFRSRTPQNAPPGPDLLAWDLSQILAAIDAHFTAALADAPSLQSIPIADYDILLTKGSAPDSCRPTLFDFLAHEALRFYLAGEQGAVVPEDAFELSADGPIFAPPEQFLRWRPRTPNSASPTLKAVRLYQALLAFHRDDTDKTAFSDVDLGRLIFGKNAAGGDEEREHYQAALKRFIRKWARLEVSARARAEYAAVLQEQERFSAAHRMARAGADAFPGTSGGARCRAIVCSIERPEARIDTESAWSDPLPTIDVTYRNVTHVRLRLVRYGFSGYLQQQWELETMGGGGRRDVLERPPEREWTVELPPTADFQPRTEHLAAPADLTPGFYVLIASCRGEFSKHSDVLSTAGVWVTELSMVVRQAHCNGFIDGFVLRARDGEPVIGATVQAWMRDRRGDADPVEQVTTDANGSFRIRGRNQPLLLLAQHGEQRVAAGKFQAQAASLPEAGVHTLFFTDRALYRPGQTIYYKGIEYQVDPRTNDYRVQAGTRVTVTIRDANHQELARIAHQCNDYGAFSGTFTAPQGRLTGALVLSTSHGSTSVSVEEYKRPKFQLELRPPPMGAALGGEVVVPGQVTSYTGAGAGGARVQWHVRREVVIPWRGGNTRNNYRIRNESRQVARGMAVTAPDGSFEIRFEALADRRIPPDAEPVYTYRIHADATDVTGETRSATRTVRTGYAAMRLEMRTEAWQTHKAPVEVTVTAASLDGAPQAARGTVRVYSLRQPARVARGSPAGGPHLGHSHWIRGEVPADPSGSISWDEDQLLRVLRFRTDATGHSTFSVSLPVGAYRAISSSADRFGHPVHAELDFQVVDPTAGRFPIRIPDWVGAQKWSSEPGETYWMLWGTGYDAGRAFVEIELGGKQLAAYWTSAGRTQQAIIQDVREEMRGGFTVRVTAVRENRAYTNERIVDVPWSNKRLGLAWEHFRSQLVPGGEEKWSLRISGADSSARPPELVAALYDASLDQFRPHGWPPGIGGFRHEPRRPAAVFTNIGCSLAPLMPSWNDHEFGSLWSYRSFPNSILAGHGLHGSVMANEIIRVTANRKPLDVKSSDVRHVTGDQEILSLPVESITEAVALSSGVVVQGGELHIRGGRSNEVAVGIDGIPVDDPEAAPASRDLGTVHARRDLGATAFFFPHLLADSLGRVTLEFTVPETVTEWRFLGFAHDRALRSGALADRVVTVKDLMVEPNPPRFIREGDRIEFTAKVTNRSDRQQTGRVRLALADAESGRSMDDALGNATPELDFDLPPNSVRGFSWTLAVPDGCPFLTYRVVGASPALSDGEEGFLPVLSRHILVTESIPLSIRGPQTKQVEFTSLWASAASPTLRHQSLTVQVVSQPAWYAILALPYLMEYPYECSEQVFNRMYANSLAQHIVGSNPRVRAVFERWRGTTALDSPLEKHQELKSLLLEETPWVRQSQAESQARRNVGVLFETHRLDDEMRRAARKLSEMQGPDGMWPWFPEGRSDEYLTLYITTGFGRLRHLGVKTDVTPAMRSLRALDEWMTGRYDEIVRTGTRDDAHINSLVALYLYGRSFFVKDQPVALQHRTAWEYWLEQARRYWPRLESRQSQAHVAIALARLGDRGVPRAILKSLEERSVQDEEFGMYWRDTEAGWWWHQAPIETQAMMIEAFSEVSADSAAVDACKVWLLKQKQTQAWRTTRSTADAVYALLMRGAGMLESDALVQVTLAGQRIAPETVEAGSGFYQQRFAASEIRPEMGRITVAKTDAGVGWGGVHWQYLEDAARVTPHPGMTLRVTKTLFVKRATKSGSTMEPVTGPLAVGDELVTRIELRTDRDLEYVHLSDQRGSGTEPVNVLSGYRFQDGLCYYESTRDAASHFFIDRLRKGTYVFEYSLRVQQRGRYLAGLASVECMYAPEFNSHSEAYLLQVQ